MDFYPLKCVLCTKSAAEFNYDLIISIKVLFSQVQLLISEKDHLFQIANAKISIILLFHKDYK